MPAIAALVAFQLLLARAVFADGIERVQENFRDLCSDNCKVLLPMDLGGLLQLPRLTGLVNTGSSVALNGKTKVRYSQVFSGLRIYGTVLTTEINSDGNVTGNMTGELVRRFSVAMMRVIATPLTALRALASQFYPQQLSNQLQFSDFEFYEQSLTWYPMNVGGQLRLAYLCRFKLSSDEVEPLIPRGLVDTISGQVLSSWNDVGFQNTYSIPGVGGNVGRAGMAVYSNLPVTQLSDGVTCQYATSDVQVQNLNGSTSGTTFTAAKARCSNAANSTADYVNGGYSAMNDAAMFGTITVAMYNSYLGLASPVANSPVNIRVHYGNAYANAFWDGTYVTIGDGGPLLYPLSVLDVVAHEISHGFTQSRSDLQLTGQSGGISEAFSDAAGQAAKFFYNGTADFLIGNLATKSGTPLRNMCNPPSDGLSIDNITKYQANMDVHYSSGLYNKAFCKLAQTPGWDIPRAFWVYAWANAVYWAQLTTFTGGVCGVRQAAIDGNLNPVDVDNAFASVGLSCQ